MEELKCGGLVETVREEFSNVVQSLLQQASNDPLTYSNSIITLSLCPFSWQDERCVIRSGVVALLDKLCVLGRDKSGASRNVSSMAWAGFQVLLNRFVQWETDQGTLLMSHYFRLKLEIIFLPCTFYGMSCHCMWSRLKSWLGRIHVS